MRCGAATSRRAVSISAAPELVPDRAAHLHRRPGQSFERLRWALPKPAITIIFVSPIVRLDLPPTRIGRYPWRIAELNDCGAERDLCLARRAEAVKTNIRLSLQNANTRLCCGRLLSVLHGLRDLLQQFAPIGAFA